MLAFDAAMRGWAALRGDTDDDEEDKTPARPLRRRSFVGEASAVSSSRATALASSAVPHRTFSSVVSSSSSRSSATAFPQNSQRGSGAAADGTDTATEGGNERTASCAAAILDLCPGQRCIVVSDTRAGRGVATSPSLPSSRRGRFAWAKTQYTSRIATAAPPRPSPSSSVSPMVTAAGACTPRSIRRAARQCAGQHQCTCSDPGCKSQ